MLIPHLAGMAAAQTFTSVAALAAFQAPASFAKLLMVFIGLVTLSMVAQGVIAVVIGVGAMKAQKEATVHLLELKAKIVPLVEQSQALVDEFGPQIRQTAARVESIAAHVEHLASLVHEKADEIAPTISAANQTAQDANLKTRAQISRVNSMVTSALDTTVRLGIAIEQGIARPSREIAGIFAGFKAGFEVLRSGSRGYGGDRPHPVARPDSSVPPPSLN